MRYLQFERHFRPFRVFSLDDIFKRDPDFDTRRLVEWQQKGYIRRIVNRWYIFSDLEPDVPLLFFVANKIYGAAYVSLESALAYYQLIPETVFAVTSVTTRKSRDIHALNTLFRYRRITPAVFFGYSIHRNGEYRFAMAEPEKALLDYLSLNPQIEDASDFEEWRINPIWLQEELDREKLYAYLNAYTNKSLSRRVDNVIEFAVHG